MKNYGIQLENQMLKKADDGKEFFSVRNIDNLSKEQILDLMNMKKSNTKDKQIYIEIH